VQPYEIPRELLRHLLDPRDCAQIPQAAVERSGYSTEPLANTLYDSPLERRRSHEVRAATAASLHPTTLRAMRRQNAINAENGGAGPAWGSTTYATHYVLHPTPQDAFRGANLQLIGTKEPNSYSRQHLTVRADRLEEPRTVYQASYGPRARSREIVFPSQTVMDSSGFAKSAFPTQTRDRPLADATAEQLHPVQVQELRTRNTPEFLNLSHPSAYRSTYGVSYGDPRALQARSATALPARAGQTGYLENNTVTVGSPGAPWARATGLTEYQDRYVDQQLGFRGRKQQDPNIVERSGYWTNS
jgi:hypothetical protein